MSIFHKKQINGLSKDYSFQIYYLFKIQSFALMLLFLLIFSTTVLSQSIYLGYKDDCLKIQGLKIDSIFCQVVGQNRYAQLLDLQCSGKKYQLLIATEIDSNGIVKSVFIRDESNFLLANEISSLKTMIQNTIFNICITEFEHSSLTKEDIFKTVNTIKYSIFLPLKE